MFIDKSQTFYLLKISTHTQLTCTYKKLIRRWDSERELFYDDILHVLQRTIDSRIINSGADICHTVFTVNRKTSITRRNHHNGKAKLKR